MVFEIFFVLLSFILFSKSKPNNPFKLFSYFESQSIKYKKKIKDAPESRIENTI